MSGAASEPGLRYGPFGFNSRQVQERILDLMPQKISPSFDKLNEMNKIVEV